MHRISITVVGVRGTRRTVRPGIRLRIANACVGSGKPSPLDVAEVSLQHTDVERIYERVEPRQLRIIEEWLSP